MSTNTGRWTRAADALRAELRQLGHIQSSNRPWEMALAAAIACGAPLLAGVWLGRMDFGLIAMLGGLVFLSLADTPMQHRMVLMMAVAFGMVACYSLGALTHFYPPAMIVALTLICVIASMTARYYRLAPPGILFPVMAAALAAYTPAALSEIPQRVGLVAMGTVCACVVAFIYSIYRIRRSPPAAAVPQPTMDFDYVVVDSVIIGASVGLSLVIAELLQLQRPYWVPVSCLAIIQSASLRMVWNRHAHRLLGTVTGLGLTWILVDLPLNSWGIAAAMIFLTFVTEILIARHYGLAVVFITPLTIYLAEATSLSQQPHWATMQARALDTAVGCLIGLAGGAALHIPAIRSRVARGVRALLPS